MYQTPGNNPTWLIQSSRLMMLCWGIALVTLVSLWGWRADGGVAAIVATTAVALDPNFLAHSPLICNDVAFTLTFLALLTLYGDWACA